MENHDRHLVKSLSIDGNITLTGDASFTFGFLDNLTKITGLTKVNTDNVTDMQYMFAGLTNLDKLDLSSFNTSKVTDMYFMFWDSEFKSLTLSSNFKFVTNSMGDNAGLNFPRGTTYSGKWENVGTGSETHPSGKNIWTNNEFMANYNGATDADTYVWQPKETATESSVTIKYQDESGNTLAPSETITGKVGDHYNFINYRHKIIGYHYVSFTGHVAGQFTDDEEIIVFKYANNDTETDPVNPGKPTDPNKPITPSKPIAPSKPTTPNKPSNNTTPKQSKDSKKSTKSKNALPQTGDNFQNANALSLIGTVLLVVTASLFRKKQKED